MATLYINEYAETASANFGREAAAPKAPPIAKQAVAITGSSVPSSAFNYKTHLIEVHPDADCSIDIGPTPSADGGFWRLTANETRFYGVNPGDSIAVIA